MRDELLRMSDVDGQVFGRGARAGSAGCLREPGKSPPQGDDVPRGPGRVESGFGDSGLANRDITLPGRQPPDGYVQPDLPVRHIPTLL